LHTLPPLEADRIALTNMFKAIAEYGRKVRLRRQFECEKTELEEPAGPKPNLQTRLPHRRKKHGPLKK
jgi:hypothetical protein